ncbi:unnamed protein product [Paramecium pentaurelia]|uniref:Uncharacterized protein n=1 Tax=Paramecium pentaurelia TaxID=43138 RepID=A0A8S1U1T5_9CILI|nr:unnamed protein product [Paramecium pentaurelia]
MLKKYLLQFNSKDYFQQKRVHTKDSEHTRHFEQHNYLKRSIATETKPALKPIDMEETRKEELTKFRSISLYNKKQIRMPTSAEKCCSNEKIRVFNIFNSTPRNVKPSRSQQQLNGFKEKVVYSSHNRQSSAAKPPISSRINDSQELFQKVSKPNMIPLRSFFKDNQVKQQQKNIKLELEKHANNNILELLLLTTGELKKKFEDEHKLRDSNSRQNSEERVRVKVRNSHKFPKDFFL